MTRLGFFQTLQIQASQLVTSCLTWNRHCLAFKAQNIHKFLLHEEWILNLLVQFTLWISALKELMIVWLHLLVLIHVYIIGQCYVQMTAEFDWHTSLSQHCGLEKNPAISVSIRITGNWFSLNFSHFWQIWDLKKNTNF